MTKNNLKVVKTDRKKKKELNKIAEEGQKIARPAED